jgi:hypothetical protein
LLVVSASRVLQVADPDERSALWLSPIQLEIDAAGGAGGPGDASRRIEAIDRCVGDRLRQGTLAIEDALGFLPEQETLHYYKKVLLKHMETTSHKARCAAAAHLTFLLGCCVHGQSVLCRSTDHCISPLCLSLRAFKCTHVLQVQETLASTCKAVAMNKKLLEQLSGSQHRTATLSLDAPCAACGLPLRVRPRCTVPQGAADLLVILCRLQT